MACLDQHQAVQGVPGALQDGASLHIHPLQRCIHCQQHLEVGCIETLSDKATSLELDVPHMQKAQHAEMLG